MVGDIQLTHLCMFLADKKVKTCHSDSSYWTIEWNSYCPKLVWAVPSHVNQSHISMSCLAKPRLLRNL